MRRCERRHVRTRWRPRVREVHQLYGECPEDPLHWALPALLGDNGYHDQPAIKPREQHVSAVPNRDKLLPYRDFGSFLQPLLSDISVVFLLGREDCR